MSSDGAPTRSGFVALAGRPNVGKSTLMNAIVGEKVAIVSPRPQTTRRAIRGVLTGEDWQLVLVDLPGVQRPRDPLTERMQRRVERALADADAALFLVNGEQEIGPGDRFIAAELRQLKTPVIAVVTKGDLVRPEQMAAQLLAVTGLGDWAEVVPCSAVSGWQVDTLADLLVERLPTGPPLYPDGEVTDEPEAVMVAELIREAALDGVRDELPHSLAVVVEEMVPREDRDLLDVRAELYVERPSQKAIVIGAGGSRLRAVGTAARHQIEALLGTPVYLDLHVKVAKDWQRDPRQLRRLGF